MELLTNLKFKNNNKNARVVLKYIESYKVNPRENFSLL